VHPGPRFFVYRALLKSGDDFPIVTMMIAR